LFLGQLANNRLGGSAHNNQSDYEDHREYGTSSGAEVTDFLFGNVKPVRKLIHACKRLPHKPFMRLLVTEGAADFDLIPLAPRARIDVSTNRWIPLSGTSRNGPKHPRHWAWNRDCRDSVEKILK